MRLGSFVTVKPETVETIYYEYRQKLPSGRVGEITGFSLPNNHPIVTFPSEGRRKEFRQTFRESELEVICL
jgi:hypothetical protein